ncbi:rRNA pseudouridine synthase [Acetobacteraceae bacterium]|nr:rRNA pseudouridine synthase [Acetobacteraceae bacterium]
MRQTSKQNSPRPDSLKKHNALRGSAPNRPPLKTDSQNISITKNAAAQNERIAKYLARCGIASRRESEKLVEAGRISVYFAELRKKERITHPSTLVGKADQVFVDDVPIDPPASPRLWLYHKPAGLITTHSDPLGRPTIFENLPKELPRVISIGRLDLNSEGLLLLTNDGNLSRELELPDRGWKRLYRVRVFGTINPEALKKLADGIVVEGVQYKSIIAEPETSLKTGRNTWLRVQLFEGKNREIRRVMLALGLKVNRLIRLAYGPFSLGELEIGKVHALTPEEVYQALPQYFPAPKHPKTSPQTTENAPNEKREDKNTRRFSHSKQNAKKQNFKEREATSKEQKNFRKSFRFEKKNRKSAEEDFSAPQRERKNWNPSAPLSKFGRTTGKSASNTPSPSGFPKSKKRNFKR